MGTWDDAHSSDQPFHTSPQTKAKSCVHKNSCVSVYSGFLLLENINSPNEPPNQQTDQCTAMVWDK